MISGKPSHFIPSAGDGMKCVYIHAVEFLPPPNILIVAL